MMMNLDTLREALIEHGVDDALQKIRESEQWEYSHAVEYAATCAAAAVVSDSREAWWCKAHASNGPKENGEHGPCWFIHFADVVKKHLGTDTKHGPCLIVRALVTEGDVWNAG